jgi:hypothetical protein
MACRHALLPQTMPRLRLNLSRFVCDESGDELSHGFQLIAPMPVERISAGAVYHAAYLP